MYRTGNFLTVGRHLNGSVGGKRRMCAEVGISGGRPVLGDERHDGASLRCRTRSPAQLSLTFFLCRLGAVDHKGRHKDSGLERLADHDQDDAVLF